MYPTDHRPVVSEAQLSHLHWRSFAVFVLSLLMAVSLGTTPASAQQITYAWVVNSLSETLSQVNLSTGQVVVNAALLGDIPQDLVIDGDQAYVTNSGLDNVQVINLATQQTTGTIEILQGSNPYSIALDDQNRAFVTNYETANVSVLDLAAGQETGVLNVLTSPEGVCVTEDRLFVTDVNCVWPVYGPGYLYAFSLATLDCVGVAVVGTNPQIVALGPDGNLHVVCTGDYGAIQGRVYILDPVTLAIEDSVLIGSMPGSLAFGPDGIGYLGSADGTLLSYHGITHEVIHGAANPIMLPASAFDVVVSPANHIYVCCFGTNLNELLELDTSGTILQSYEVGLCPISVALQQSATGVKNPLLQEKTYELLGNYPEPFNAATTVIFSLNTSQSVRFSVFDAAGRVIEYRHLDWQSAGKHSFTFTPVPSLSSGRYFYQLRGAEEKISGSMIYLK